MTSRKLKDLALKIKKLEEHELIYLLSRVLPDFAPYENDPGTGRSGFFLGTYRYSNDTMEMDIVAYPDSEEYGDSTGPDWGLCQSSPSEKDGMEYVSNVKRCVSPFDGRKLTLT